MASNSFGTIFRITTWGESHGKAIGVVIDGCPAGLPLDECEIQAALALRAPGRNSYISPRTEADHAEILSGVFEGVTTGAPISILIPNRDVDGSKYAPIKDVLRPGHANYTYLQKYGLFDYRGGGRASARETACRVAAGAVAQKLLGRYGIEIAAYLKQVGTVQAQIGEADGKQLRSSVLSNHLFCPDPQAAKEIMAVLDQAKVEGNSLGGIVEFIATGVPTGLGDPVYEKLGANLAHAMMGLPAVKGFEMGSGFGAVSMEGSEHNDCFVNEASEIRTATNHAGGTLGGISTGMPVIGRIAFKPASSIMKPQPSVTTSGESITFQLPSGSRHDPCVAIRAVPVVEAMVALVLTDAILLNRCVRV